MPSVLFYLSVLEDIFTDVYILRFDMSYYNSKFDLDFKQSFSSSYVNFTDDEISNMALRILSELTKVGDHSDQKFLNLLKNKKIHQQLIDKSFEVNQRYNETYIRYLKSSKLLDLFNSSSGNPPEN